MAKIPFLYPRTLSCGTKVAWNWKPSPRLRQQGWSNQRLGEGPMPRRGKPVPPAAIVAAAEEWNAKAMAGKNAEDTRGAPRMYRFVDLCDAYRRSADFLDLRTSTKANYDVRMRQLQGWAQDGELPIAAIDSAMVRDLRDGMESGGASRHKIVATMRVLKLLLNWAKAHEWVTRNAAEGVKTRAAPSRNVIIMPRDVELAAQAARDANRPTISLYLLLALWTMQRQADLLGLNRMMWRPMENCASSDAAVLAGKRGDVMGFRLRQDKTGAWLDIPVLPEFHDDIEAAFRKSQWLFTDDNETARVYAARLLHRHARPVLDAVGLQHAKLLDLRRSGMCMFRDYGVEDSGTTSLSGHAVLGHRTILDTYMPKNTRSACAALAAAQRARLARMEREEAK